MKPSSVSTTLGGKGEWVSWGRLVQLINDTCLASKEGSYIGPDVPGEPPRAVTVQIHAVEWERDESTVRWSVTMDERFMQKGTESNAENPSKLLVRRVPPGMFGYSLQSISKQTSQEDTGRCYMNSRI